MRARIQILVHWLGRAGIAFLLLLAAYVALGWIAPRSGFRLVLEIGWLMAGIWLAIRLLWLVARQAVWRLRHRLLVTYLFIAVVPLALIAGLALLGGYLLVSQIAVYLVTTELDRRVDGLAAAAASVAQNDAGKPAEVMRQIMDLLYRDRYPGMEMLVRQGGRQFRFPDNGALPAPPDGWQPGHGVLQREGEFYLFSYFKTAVGDVTDTAPLTQDLLSGLVPGLGLVDVERSAGGTRKIASNSSARRGGRAMPAAVNRFDIEVPWFATVSAVDWQHPGQSTDLVLSGLTRVSAVLGTVFNRKADVAQEFMQVLLAAGLVVFVLVEIICWVIGITMTRNITGAVHHLYEGTQRIMQGDFSHRIEVTGKDQLAELGVSFNRMTENLARLLAVAQEKERLQSEIEIAREVQSQLYPHSAPHSQTLHLTAVCRPARIVSGDYYDYEIAPDAHVALAIGDVAGKGISAALLMATVQSSLRTQLSGNADGKRSAADLVSRLNQYLYANTSAEKYSTLCLGLYDEADSSFVYTNAGHLPPALVRRGAVHRLDVNGTVVGAFPFAEYGESRMILERGDLLVFFTDGVTEPENEYGEMFGEERFLDLLTRNAHCGEEEIIRMVVDSVRQWTGSEELQDDMTLLLARRI